MAFDGIVVNSLVGELSEELLNSKIDKIYQPEKDEVYFKIRSKSGNKKLVISASASNPRIFLADGYEKENPKKAPQFTMTLRKHIQSGVIVGVSQVGFDRIIKISIESYDELKEKTIKDIYVEIMGKHSNIIVVSRRDSKIIDSIKRVPLSVSRARQILPGMEYELPPSQNKINPLYEIDFDRFRIKLGAYEGEIYKSIYNNILGLSPLIAREVCVRADLDPNKKSIDLDDGEIKKIFEEIKSIFLDLNKKIYHPCIVIDRNRDKIIEFSSIKLTQYENFEEVTVDSVSEMVEKYYDLKDKKERIAQRSASMKKTISLKLDRLKNKIEKQEEEYKKSKTFEKYKINGELLTAFIYMIQRGMSEVVLQNFYEENKEVRISLDENLSPSDNAQKYFKKYNKLKTANHELKKMLEENYLEKSYLENIILSIENTSDYKELKEIKEELIREGYIKSYKIPKKNNKPESRLNKYLSSGGNIIIVGKNNRQNDYITLRLADNDDLWFHTKDIAGSHVILKSAGKNLADEELMEAAQLAAYYSKGRLSSNVPVDYTQRKNVKKPSGAKPGMVIYEKNKTLYITPSDEKKAKIRAID